MGTERFECKKCGHCCKFMESGGNVNCLPVWEWELTKLLELSKQKNISLNFRPVDLVMDKRSGLAFCIHYWLDAPCPFLEEDKCSIYENRPLICKGFPMVDNPFFNKEVFELNIGDCKAFSYDEFKLAIKGTLEDTPIKLSKKIIVERYKNFFGEEIFINSFIINQIDAFVGKTMKDLIEDKKIKLRKISKFDYGKYDPIPFFEFLKLKGFVDENGKLHLIRQLIDTEKIKNLLQNFVN